jgi:hypothetical protein
LAAGDLPRSLEHLSSLLSLSGDNRLKHDLLLKAVELTRHCAPSLAVVAPAHAGPLLKCLRLLLVDKEPTLRSQALRVLRYLLTDWHMLSHMLRLNMDLLVVRSLERDSKFLWERMQALKFVRKWMHMLAQSQAAVKNGKPASTSLSAPNGGVTLPPHQPLELTRSLVQSLVAIAEQPKDDFRRVCLDAIRELSQTDTHACMHACSARCTLPSSAQNISRWAVVGLFLLCSSSVSRLGCLLQRHPHPGRLDPRSRLRGHRLKFDIDFVVPDRFRVHEAIPPSER